MDPNTALVAGGEGGKDDRKQNSLIPLGTDASPTMELDIKEEIPGFFTGTVETGSYPHPHPPYCLHVHIWHSTYTQSEERLREREESLVLAEKR